MSVTAATPESFAELVEPYRRALEIHCYRMLGSAHDAEDVVQETLLRAWRSLDRFERRSSVHTWLYRIATNACLDELERRPRQAVPVAPYPDEHARDGDVAISDPAARYAQREGMELAFLTAIQRLPGRQRAVLILRDVLGWSAAEAADALDSTTAAVNSALQRARGTIDAALPARSTDTVHRELLDRYVDAWEREDLDALVALLQEDAVLDMPPEDRVVGAQAIVAFFARGGKLRHEPVVVAANGELALGMCAAGEPPHAVLVFDVRDGAIAQITAHRDPATRARFAPYARSSVASSRNTPT